jgi:hypothetical protein
MERANSSQANYRLPVQLQAAIRHKEDSNTVPLHRKEDNMVNLHHKQVAEQDT